jgi:hypothetical protein
MCNKMTSGFYCCCRLAEIIQEKDRAAASNLEELASGGGKTKKAQKVCSALCTRQECLVALWPAAPLTATNMHFGSCSDQDAVITKHWYGQHADMYAAGSLE